MSIQPTDGPALKPKVHRLDLVHLLRGLAALIVLFGHISTATDARFPLALDVLGRYSGLGVFVFFMISGFVVPWSLWEQRYTIGMFPKYLLRRLVRLDPPYLAMMAVGIAVQLFRSQRAGLPFPFSASTIALHLGYLAGLAGHPWIVTVFWTLGIEFQFYLLMGVTFPLIVRLPAWSASSNGPSRRNLWQVLLGLACLQIALTFAADVYAYPFATWIYYRAYFLAGILIFAVRALGMHWSLYVGFCVISAGIDGFSLEWGTVTILGLLIISLPNRLPWVWTTTAGAALNGLGYISYSLYLTHEVCVGGITRRAVAHGWMSSTGGAVLVYAAETALALSVAAIFYYLVERPSVRLSHRVRLRSASPAV